MTYLGHAMDIHSVAKRAGVSSATVSRVLNGSTKVRAQTAAHVRKIIQELNYVPNNTARTLRSGQSNLYGLIVSDIRNPFFPDLIEHFESLATEQGIDVTVANTGYSEERLLRGVRRLLEREVDGIAVLTSEVSSRLLAILRESKVPTVFLNQPSTIADFHNITVDYVRGFVEAVAHLRMLGHTEIGFIAGPPTLSSAVRRRKAFLAALRSSQIVSHEEWILAGNHQLSGGEYAAERIFSMRRRPTAVICSNDMTAIGFLHAAHRLGKRVPSDLSLVGFDDLLLSEIVQPSLTTLHLSRQEIASRAFLALQKGREDRGEPRPAIIQPRLIVRESSGPRAG
jgi:DNA-binding LacI/PurR family transcriptional regulator